MKKASELTLREKVGQMIIIRIQGKEIGPEEIEMINEYKIGGIILYRKNYDSYKEMINIVNEITRINKEAGNIPLFISIDQEGGRVNRMPREIKRMKSAGKLSSKHDIDMIKKSGNIMAKMLRESGINMNFAPVLDIQRFDDNHPIGDRCYGKDAVQVSKNGIAVMKSLSEGKVIPVVKHFPGHGATTKDSHWRLPKINDSLEKLEHDDIVPFKDAIEAGADAIMVGHLKVKAMDRRYPASLSKKVVKGYLIDKLCYKGLIITDDLKMRGICLRYGFVRAAEKACAVGNDMIMIGVGYKTVKKTIKKLEKSISYSKINEEEIEKRVQKIISLKEKYRLNDEIAKGCNVEEINKSIENLNEKISQV